ncbi:hypothetical protein [Phaffia rhodozyma]|uniref:Uncharacterized protein n=1 Tax=Phaffia rhodozyma TaxID=264483 RepID=A0A0F7SFG3_PHARH|nr:hypothetical protein [Phaffia rhodozyma]
MDGRLHSYLRAFVLFAFFFVPNNNSLRRVFTPLLARLYRWSRVLRRFLKKYRSQDSLSFLGQLDMRLLGFNVAPFGNTYELVPTSQDAFPVPNSSKSTTQLNFSRTPWLTAARVRWTIGAIPALSLLALLGCLENQSIALPASAPNEQTPIQFTDNSAVPEDHWHATEYLLNHPIVQLPADKAVRSSIPIPYQAPSSACLLHLYTLADLTKFNPALCPCSEVPSPIDVVVTFVNGSDPFFRRAYDNSITHGEKAHDAQPAIKRYSNMGEMKYSLRSVGRNLAGPRLQAGWVRGLGGDYKDERIADDQRLGQIPTWLNWKNLQQKAHIAGQLTSRAEDGLDQGRKLAWHFHSEIFLGDEEWTKEALPNFNSFAIESQISNIPSLNPNFISMNDDFFILRPLSASDFHTDLFGPVLRLQDNLKVTGKQNARVGDPGEWGGLEWGAYILGRRHPNNGLEYLNHLPKTLSQPHLHELSLTFPQAISDASKRKFRRQKTGGPDIEMAFLQTHYIRQRFREALLYAYVVARPTRSDGSSIWGRIERDELIKLGVDGWSGVIGDFQGKGELNKDVFKSILSTAKEETALSTDLFFVSASGLPPNSFGPKTKRSIDLSSCLGTWWSNSEEEIDSVEMFKRLAFERVDCGDMLISSILSLSAEPGLTDLLPRPDTFFNPSGSESEAEPPIYQVPHLPLTPTWEEADFTLPALFPSWSGLDPRGVDLMDWTVRILGRYRFSLGQTPSYFKSITDKSSVPRVMTHINQHPDLALLALNDDLRDSTTDNDRALYVAQIRSWGEQMFPGEEWWEF